MSRVLYNHFTHNVITLNRPSLEVRVSSGVVEGQNTGLALCTAYPMWWLIGSSSELAMQSGGEKLSYKYYDFINVILYGYDTYHRHALTVPWACKSWWLADSRVESYCFSTWAEHQSPGKVISLGGMLQGLGIVLTVPWVIPSCVHYARTHIDRIWRTSTNSVSCSLSWTIYLHM